MAVRIVESRSQDEWANWDRFVLDNPMSTGYHLATWGKVFHNAFKHECVYLMASQADGEIQGVLPLVTLSSRLFGKFLISLPFVNYGGVVARTEEAKVGLLEEAVRRAKMLEAGHIELRHEEAPNLDWPSIQRKVSMRLQLPNRYEELWKAFSSKLRSQIRRGQKEGMTVRFGAKDCLNDFYLVFARGMRDLGTPVYGRQFFESILSAFPKESRLCVVYLKESPLAAGLVYGFRQMLEIPWAASDKRYSRLAPNMLLYSSVLEYACQQGFQVFDFGRSTPDSGTYRFKEQWGARPVPLHWCYWLAEGQGLPQLHPQNPKYRFAIQAWRKLPLVVANYLGPHVVKYLP